LELTLEKKRCNINVGENMMWIEAQPSLMEKLQETVSPFGHQAINATLHNQSGVKTSFYVTNKSVSSSLLHINTLKQSLLAILITQMQYVFGQ
jgi:hypothetical protein